MHTHNINGVQYVDSITAASILGLHPGTLRNRRADRTETIQTIKVGHAVLYPLAEVEELAKKREAGR
ncbi:hypothetical protein [Streptomyces thermodiastaticus]|uniref:hypothetical protein n=1 Tax=Streptomyces thermodiastaticus TaxID=44061 RepID=UPI00167741B0|nr:hypothetical protein [Streptomyces thermodiastaticus]MCE7552767.1 hypothetical protein [Streptomyces thermodiastaticus]GHF89058.1 hypothetical protein GCM10018787_42180 [Streptomyces thermodiastaticus]